jgi:hypothetical protein
MGPRAYFSLFAILPLLAVAGCSSLSEPAGVSYAKAVTQLGINPVYPPREDLQVGDIYAVEKHSYTDRLKAKSAFIAVNDVTGEIRKYLASRYKFADTEVEAVTGSSADQKVKRLQQDSRDGQLLPTRSDLTTLPLDGLPQIEVDSGITVGVQGQPQGLAAVFGFAGAKTLKMSLQYGHVTSYEIPMAVAEDELRGFCGSHDWMCENEYLANWVNQKYQLGPGNPGYVQTAGILMVTKVYLARQIVYTFNDATLAAAVASAVGDDGKTVKAAPQVSTAQIDKILATKDPKIMEAASDLINSLNTSAASNGGSQGAFSIGVVNKQSISISEIFDRPVVVGYEGFSALGGTVK